MNDLNELIPQSVPIVVGRTEEEANKNKGYKIYPLAISHVFRFPQLVEKIMKQIIAAMRGEAVPTNNLFNEFLPELMDFLAVSSFNPNEQIDSERIENRKQYLNNNMTLPQLQFAIGKMMELNSFDDMLKKMMALLPSQTKTVQKPTGAAPLKR